MRQTAGFDMVGEAGVFRGDSFSEQIVINQTGYNFTGSSVLAQVRSNDTLILQFVTTVVAGIGVLTIALSASAATTKNLNAGIYRYDIQVTTGSEVWTCLAGLFEVKEDASFV